MISLMTSGLHVQPTTISAYEDDADFWSLVVEYAKEAAVKGLPTPALRAQGYKRMEAAGVLHPFSALLDGRMIGFVTVLATEMPHYGRVIAITESFFVTKAQRHTGAGLKLLSMAEDKARALGSPGLLVSTPFGGDLCKVLPRRGYAETNRVFFKEFAA